MSLADDVIAVLQSVTPEALAALGLTELQPLLGAIDKLAGDVVAAIEQHGPALAAEVDAADVSADIVENQKFGQK